MKRAVYIPLAVGLLALGLHSAASANPRSASSKIMGDFTPFDSSNQVSRSATNRYVMPAPVEQPRAVTAQTPSTRRFSYEPQSPATAQPPRCQPATEPQAATPTRRYSYEPQATPASPVYRPRPMVRNNELSPVRGAASKILGEY